MTFRPCAFLMIGFLILAAQLPAGAPPPPFPVKFEVIEIAPLTGGEESHAKGVNDAGYVTGFSLDTNPDPDESRPFLWNPATGKTQSIPSLSQSTVYGEGNAISNTNFIGGTSKSSFAAEYRGFINQGEFLLPTVPYQLNGGVLLTDIVNNGTACGFANVGPDIHAVLIYRGNTGDLGSLPGIANSRAYGINDNHYIVGNCSGVDPFQTTAFLFDGAMNPLQALGGSWAAAFGINNASIIVGYSQIAGDSAYNACAWSNKNDPPDGYGALLGAINSAFHEVNNLGDKVGWSESNGAPAHRAVIAPAGISQLIDLNTFLPPASGWVLREAWDISDTRLIVGWGELNGQKRGFLMRPVPAPGIVAYYDFTGTGGLQGWGTLSNIPPFASPTITDSPDGLVISPNNQFNAFGIAQSPNIPVKTYERYRAVFEISTNEPDATLVPQFRVRVGQQVINAAWVMNVDSVGGAAPAQGQTFRYEFDLLPADDANPGVYELFLAIDITHFNPADSDTVIIYLKRAWIEVSEELPKPA